MNCSYGERERPTALSKTCLHLRSHQLGTGEIRKSENVYICIYKCLSHNVSDSRELKLPIFQCHFLSYCIPKTFPLSLSETIRRYY